MKEEQMGAFVTLCHSLKSTCNRTLLNLVKKYGNIREGETVLEITLHNQNYILILDDDTRVKAIRINPNKDFSDYKFYAKDVRYYFTIEEMCEAIDCITISNNK